MPAPPASDSSSLLVSAGLFIVVVLASQGIQNRRENDKEKKHLVDLDLGHRYSMKRHYLTEKQEASLESRNHIADFEPKNSNWNHFEIPDEENEQEEPMIEDDCSINSASSEEEFLWTNNSIRRRRASSLSRSPTNGEKSSSWKSKLASSKAAKAVQRSFGSFGTHSSVIQDEDELDEDWQNVNVGPRMTRQSSAPLPGTTIPRRPSYEPQDRNRVARRRYNAQIMPNKVVLMRHGQSMGNIDEGLYSVMPDNSMPLTKLGWEQARKAGQVLKDKVLPQGETVHFIVSPYVRAVETFHGVVSAWCDPVEFKYIKDRDKRLKAWYGRLLELGLTWHEDPRIREQDFGNYQNPELIKKFKSERNRFGSFFYRFPHGESASDVFDRVSTFLDSLWRSFYLNRSRNYVLVTHGISIRVLLARYFRYTIEQFQMLANPKNCEMVILKHDGAGRLGLEGRCEQTVTEDENGENHVIGSTFHERLRVVPLQYVPKVKIRISYDD
eukprot:CAMPEP_0202491156 /NCGR_PEP_ID=MMETSP1361-20130828/8308_1 /ASSEMBLY_ACC=CAM_ASM_000849 /TAXON_ID=210615 /ORGANISM="Staurosira complex sp., Strain CCMP2646" /LENGTH=496 /DNA_ID=CAMNT_0049121159 /DNA_START=88 /DNA_END=1578 /DNA_ORIENTATION=+